MRRLVFTRLVLPFVFVAGMISIPFVWFPGMDAPPGENKPAPALTQTAPANSSDQSPSTPSRAGSRPGPFQRAMTLGFALILLSVILGGVMLYGITRRQTVSFRRRFAPNKAAESSERKSPPPA
ncbi:hypothetical protein ACFLQ0_01275 [Nitrospinota bacterium]